MIKDWCLVPVQQSGVVEAAGWMIAGLSRPDYEADCPK